MQLLKKHYLAMRVEKILQALGDIAYSLHAAIGFIFTLVIAFLAPIKFNVQLMLMLIGIDIFVAMMAVFMEKKRECKGFVCALKSFYGEWSASIAFNSAPKIMFYFCLILVGFHAGRVFDDHLMFSRGVMGVICYTEITSIIRHGDKACGTNIWELLVNQIQKLLPGKK